MSVPAQFQSVSVATSSEDQTEALAQILGETLPPSSVVALRGGLGAGKTAFTRGLARGLGIDPRDISSPTFLYLVEHPGGRLDLAHADLYRLESLDGDARREACESIGLGEIFEGPGIAAVEWWDYWVGPPPARCVVVEFASLSGDNRRITLEFSGSDLASAAAATAAFRTASE